MVRKIAATPMRDGVCSFASNARGQGTLTIFVLMVLTATIASFYFAIFTVCIMVYHCKDSRCARIAIN
jgi:hypothetical protein